MSKQDSCATKTQMGGPEKGSRENWEFVVRQMVSVHAEQDHVIPGVQRGESVIAESCRILTGLAIVSVRYLVGGRVCFLCI